MIRNLDSKARAGIILILVSLGLLLIQHTRFAFLPAGADGFLRGFAFGVAIIMVLAYLTGRSSKTKP